MDLDFEALAALGISLASLLNLGLAYYNTKKRIPSEVDKQRAEAAESYSEAAESNLIASKTSNELLLQRIAELRKEKRDAWNYIAILKRQLIEAQLTIPEYVPVDTDPNIKT